MMRANGSQELTSSRSEQDGEGASTTALRPIRNQLLDKVDLEEHLRLFYPQSWKTEPNGRSRLAQRAALEWFETTELMGVAGARAVLEEEHLALSSGYLFPTANFEQLVTLAEFLGLWRLFDELPVGGARGPWREADLPACEVPGAVQGASFSPAAEPFLRAWRGLCQRFIQRSEWWRTQLSDRFTDWVCGTLERRALSQAAAAPRVARGPMSQSPPPDLHEGAVGIMPVFDFIEYVEAFELPAAVRQHPVMQELHAIGSKLMVWVEDLVRLETILRADGPHPIKPLRETGELSPAHAISRIVELHNQSVFQFLDVERELPGFGELQPLVDSYLQLMHYAIRGFAEWKLGAGAEGRSRQGAHGPVSLSLCSFSED
jgi:hypothetical protein